MQGSRRRLPVLQLEASRRNENGLVGIAVASSQHLGQSFAVNQVRIRDILCEASFVAKKFFASSDEVRLVTSVTK